jgi:hypothetical protein
MIYVKGVRENVSGYAHTPQFKKQTKQNKKKKQKKKNQQQTANHHSKLVGKMAESHDLSSARYGTSEPQSWPRIMRNSE